MSRIDLAGSYAVVVGGTSGIGRAIALGLADAGADVIAASRSMSAVECVAAEIEAKGRRTLRAGCDAASRRSLQALHDAALKLFGRVDILVDSAGITKRVPTLECSEEDWNGIMEINLKGTLNACQIFGATMLQQKYGRIITWLRSPPLSRSTRLPPTARARRR